jgi:opacity protein-like surface antigen
MGIRRILGLCVAALVVAPAVAAAQDTKKVGMTIAYPASVGLLWHASDKVAIRPDFSFGGSSSETETPGFSLGSDGWNVNVGISALFYLRTYDRLRTYVTPRFSYGHSSTTSDASDLIDAVRTTTSNIVGGSGSFGAQYGLGDRFSLFGEIGFAFTHATTESTVVVTEGTSNNWGLRSGIGVVVYF